MAQYCPHHAGSSSRGGHNAGLIFLILGFFGLGGGLGMPALTDTVMAAVPERDANRWPELAKIRPGHMRAVAQMQ